LTGDSAAGKRSASELPPPIDLLGVPFHAVDFEEAVRWLMHLAAGERPTYAVTANVDHVVRFSRCPDVRPLYTEADLVVADGMPLIWASRLLRTPLPCRVAGSDLFPRLCGEAAGAGLSVFLLGGAPGSAERAVQVLTERHPNLRVAGTYCPDFGFENDPREMARINEMIAKASPDILFVGLGSPKQERWIAENRTRCGAALSIGVGISFSFVAGDVRRAPRWLQRLGLEWAHRLCQEPGRLWKRYLVHDLPFVWLIAKAWWRRRS